MAAPRTIPAPGPVILRIATAMALAAAIAVGLIIAVTGPATAAPAPVVGAASATPAPTPTAGSAVRSECPVPVPDGYSGRVECGELLVPERRGQSAEDTTLIRLPYAVVSSTAADPAADPLVFPTTGGRGTDSLGALEYFLTDGAWAAASRDVILIEQRGDLLSEPSLDCPEVSVANLTVDGVYLTGTAAVQQRQALLAACRDRLTADGVDLAAYATRAAAADLAALRRALGYDAWNLYGLGYGSRLALTVMRDHPEGLRAVILDGPYPPQLNPIADAPASLASAVDRLVFTCEADAECAQRYPDLPATIAGVLEQAAVTPFELVVDSPEGGAIRLELDDTAIARGLVRALADAAAVPSLPFVIDQLAQGNADAALPLAQELVDADGQGAEGLALSQQCAEVLPFVDGESVAEAYAADPIAAHLGEPDLVVDCATWDVPALGERESTAVSSDIPTLVLTGGFDPLTPYAAGEATVETLSAGRLTLFGDLSHGTVWQSTAGSCAPSVARQFLDDPAGASEAPCIQEETVVSYPTTASIDPTSALYRLERELVQQRELVPLVVLLASLVLMLATLGYGIVVALGRRVRLRGDIPAGAVSAAVMAAAFNLAYAAGIAIVFATSDATTRALGIPAAAWPMLLLPFAGIVMTILLIVLIVRAWLQDDGTLFHRIALSVSAAGSLVFAGWLLAHGLLML